MKYTIKRRMLLVVFFTITSLAHASTIDTVSTFSPSMQKYIKAVIIAPDTYSNKEPLPVVYLLHGYSGGIVVY